MTPWTDFEHEDKSKDGAQDNTELETQVIQAMETVKRWASNGEVKLGHSVNSVPFQGKAVKDVVTYLLGENDEYKKHVKTVRGE